MTPEDRFVLGGIPIALLAIAAPSLYMRVLCGAYATSAIAVQIVALLIR